MKAATFKTIVPKNTKGDKMERNSFKELKTEFTTQHFTHDEILDLAFAGYVALKDYKDSLRVEAQK